MVARSRSALAPPRGKNHAHPSRFPLRPCLARLPCLGLRRCVALRPRVSFSAIPRVPSVPRRAPRDPPGPQWRQLPTWSRRRLDADAHTQNLMGRAVRWGGKGEDTRALSTRCPSRLFAQPPHLNQLAPLRRTSDAVGNFIHEGSGYGGDCAAPEHEDLVATTPPTRFAGLPSVSLPRPWGSGPSGGRARRPVRRNARLLVAPDVNRGSRAEAQGQDRKAPRTVEAAAASGPLRRLTSAAYLLRHEDGARRKFWPTMASPCQSDGSCVVSTS